ncbi:MAG: TldD/PmbA family protein [Dehalococcoidales bacterium]|nr:TldD/PmbA family protein [Dehalococcoidales bacterium]
MRDLTDRALNTAQVLGASYADVRVVRRQVQTITVKNGRVEGLSTGESQGFGARVVVDGAWGFASSFKLQAEEADRIAGLAVRIAKASSLVKGEDVNLGPPVATRGQYRTHVLEDPFAVPLEDKIGHLLAASEAMGRVKGISVNEASFEAFRDFKVFANSEGAYVEQEITETGGGIEATAIGNDDMQKRSYPNSFGRHQGTAGYEFFTAMDLAGNAQRIADEAVALLTAKPCPQNVVTTLILDPTQLALQVHESCGHPIELDRALGMEASYAGTSFLTTDKLGKFRYGSDLVNIVADATVPTGLGTFGYDDEGVPAQRVQVIKNGIFVNYLTSRETAPLLGQTSNGTMRADGWDRIPLIRMTNINLEPGNWTFADLIADTDDGIYMQTNKSWSIDDKRLNFQFGTEIAWEIKNGKLGQMVKNATYTGITPQFWGSCDAICSAAHWNVWGTPNCGKGEPPQTAHVGHGTAPARFHNVRVGLMK